MSDPEPQKESKSVRTNYFWAILGISSLLGLSSLLLFVEQSEPPFLRDPNLIKTTRPTSFVIAPMTLMGKLQWKYYELKRKTFPNPMTYSFNASAPARCSIHGLLNQCMDAGGMQYCIEKNLAAGSVMFGNDIVLNGRQWIEAFEAALLTNKVEWWDPKQNAFRRENLVLLRYRNRITLVLPEATARQYEHDYPVLRRALPQNTATNERSHQFLFLKETR